MNIQFGADYYPEHWPAERWAEDARLMKEMGLGLVRMAEFAWKHLEPREGEFCFDWLDKAIETLEKEGIKVLLGTPTPAPPAWVIEKYPDILPVDSQGVRQNFGGRHHNCQSNHSYRHLATRIVKALSSHYKNHKNVVAWQVDNELGCAHENLCYCQSCSLAFQNWLQKKYGSIEELNQHWGTVFWSQEYDDFQQISSPKVLPTGHNPSLLLDWKRFHSDLIISFQQLHIDILRKNCPQQEITHNFMGQFDITDYFDLSAPLDFVSHDQYPTGFFDEPQPGKTPSTLAAILDLMRGLKQQTFCIMEQQAGPTGWTTLGRTPAPGQLALWTAQSVARGADCVVFFRWRTCTVGTEQYWHGILPHSGKPGRRFYELQKTISQLTPLMQEFRGTLSGAEVAILFDYQQNWALEIQPHHPDLDYIEHLQVYYDAFYQRQVPVDFISKKQDFSAYKIIVAPLLFLMNPELEAKLEAYVRAGGQLVLSMRTGVKNEDNCCMTERELPGKLGEVLGIEICDYDCLRDLKRSIQWGSETASYQGLKWCDIISLKGAAPLAQVSDGWYAETPIITENAAGKGHAYYVGTEADAALALRLVEQLLKRAGVQSLAPVTSLEVVQRKAEKKDFYFVLNHNEEEASFSTLNGWQQLIGTEKIPAYGFSVFVKG